MLSNSDLERLIAEKRSQIEKEKIVLGLSEAGDTCELQDIENHNGAPKSPKCQKTVRIAEGLAEASSDNVAKKEQEETEIPADLERYIRRYLGLPVMLKAGEYSPNNPLIRAAERGAGGDVLLGLGEYERRRNTLRKLRQQQYREYLDQQAKIKQEAKEQAEKERREREERERQIEEEREQRRQLIDQQNIEAEKRRCRLQDENVERERVRQSEEEKRREQNVEKLASVCYLLPSPPADTSVTYRNKVERGVQVGVSKPLSVAVQTDHAEIYRLSSPTQFQITQAERELSPRTVLGHDKLFHNDKPAYNSNKPTYNNENPTYNNEKPTYNNEKPTYNDKPAYHTNTEEKLKYQDDRPLNNQNRTTYDNYKPVYQDERNKYMIRSTIDDDRPIQPAGGGDGWRGESMAARRRSYGDFDERSSSLIRNPSKERLLSDARHTYMPSIFDSDAIQIRNQQAEKEAHERRQFYQRELKNQIQEQQRIREERKNREKMLEAAEMRRLEEQLRMLRSAQHLEQHTIRDIDHKMKESATDFEKKRTTLQKEIDNEQQKLFRAHTQPRTQTHISHTKPHTSHSETNVKLPAFYNRQKRLPFSTNIAENSIFNPNYDVDSYLRKNLNPKKEIFTPNFELPQSCERKIVIEKALVHDQPKERPKYEPTFLKNLDELRDETPIPVLRHSPKTTSSTHIEENTSKSDGMRLIEDKWKVPAVQKNILKSLPKDDGNNVSILTQLGSIRRQLQLEQLRLDNLMSKSD
ncbi:hypothetical protein O0L34_g1881 [Tuta absoluta]|nr:hypothetical protein O0L34_g1881 [Tuta absoluta]